MRETNEKKPVEKQQQQNFSSSNFFSEVGQYGQHTHIPKPLKVFSRSPVPDQQGPSPRNRRSSQIVVTSANDHEKLYATLTRSLNSKLLARPVSFDLPKKSRPRPIGYHLGGEQSLYGIFCRIKVVADSTSSCYQLTDVYSTPSPPILYQRTNIFFLIFRCNADIKYETKL